MSDDQHILCFLASKGVRPAECNIVLERTFKSEKRGSVSVNGVTVMAGSFESFKNSEETLNLPEFTSLGRIVYLIEQAIKKSGYPVQIRVEDFD